MKKYIYCYDEDVKNKLIMRGFRLLNTQNATSGNVYVFKNDTSLFNRDFTVDTIKQSCCFDNKLKMSF